MCYVPLSLKSAYWFGASSPSAMTFSFGAELGALSFLGCAFITDQAMAIIAQRTTLTALFVEEQCHYPGPDDTRCLDLSSACVQRYAPVMGASKWCGS